MENEVSPRGVMASFSQCFFSRYNLFLVSIMSTNNSLRHTTLVRRDQLQPKQRHRLSRHIASRFLNLPELESASAFFIYVNFRSEVETLPLIHHLLQENKVVTVPWTDRKNHALRVIRITDPDQDLRPGYCGIPEPGPSLLAGPSFDPARLDVVILPGSVFDRHGGRLGYGGGYYDRFLVHAAPQALRIALAYDLQVVDRLNLQPHDQPMDILITESDILRFARETIHA